MSRRFRKSSSCKANNQKLLGFLWYGYLVAFVATIAIFTPEAIFSFSLPLPLLFASTVASITSIAVMYYINPISKYKGIRPAFPILSFPSSPTITTVLVDYVTYRSRMLVTRIRF